MPLLDCDYGNLFDELDNKYHHFLDTVIYNLDIVNMGKDKQDDCAFTVLDNDVFIPVGLYAGAYSKTMIFDSGCTLAVIPYELDFFGRIKPV